MFDEELLVEKDAKIVIKIQITDILNNEVWTYATEDGDKYNEGISNPDFKIDR